MKITTVTAECVRAPLGSEFRPTWNTGVVQDAIATVLIRVETDDGLVGIGAGPCSGPAAATLIEDQFDQLLRGVDPFRIEEISRLTRPVANAYARMNSGACRATPE